MGLGARWRGAVVSGVLMSWFRRFKKDKHDLKETASVANLRKTFRESKADLKSFKMQRTIGTGTFGRVRLAIFAVDGKDQPFAIKILHKARVTRLKQVEHVKSEKDSLMKLHHPFIVDLFHTFQDKKSLYLVLEFVVGGEFFSYLRQKGRLGEETARFYAAEILVTLEYMHSKSVVYRDLKPENILIAKDGHVKLVDFGFSKSLEGRTKDRTRTWTICGTPEYLAPEIIYSIGHSYGVDWWALGVLIFEMLCGYPPFYDEQPFGIYQKIVAGVKKVKFPGHLDPRAKQLIMALLREDHTQRLGCQKAGAHDIRKHRWFKPISFKRIRAVAVKPPFVPKIRSALDASCFESYPESDGEDRGDDLLTEQEDEEFRGF